MWAPPGKDANPARWRYDLRKGFVPPGHATDPAGTQYELPQGYDPAGSPRGFHVVESPPGTAAPIGAINYTPDTREVHDVGTLAPVDKRNISLLPDSGLHRLAYNRRVQRAATLGTGHDAAQTQTPFPGTPPISSAFPSAGPAQTPKQPDSSMAGGPGANQGNGFWFRAFGAGQDETDTDPTAGVDASAPSPDETAGPSDPNWANVGPEYTGHRRIDPTHVAEMVEGKPLGIWIKKPGATDLDPNAWTFRATPGAKTASGVTYTSEPQPDGSILLHGSNGDIKRVAAPKAPPTPAPRSGKPYRDQSGNLVQEEANGNIRVIERAPTPRAPGLTFGQPQQAPDGSWIQVGSNGEIRAVPGTRPSTATEKWGPPESKPDGSIWQQNMTTQKWEVVQPPDKNLTDPFTVGNRLVKFDPESKSYKEVYRAPSNMSLQTLSDGRIVGVNLETGDLTPITTDPTAAAAADLKQRQGEQNLRVGEQNLRTGEQTLRRGNVDIQSAEMGMIPQPSISGGNLIVPEGAQADVSYWDPTTGQVTRSTLGQRRPVSDVLSSYGFQPSPGDQQAAQAVPGGASIPTPATAAPPNSVPDTGVLAPPGVAGTASDPLVQADTAGYTPPPTPFEQSDIHEGTSRRPAPVEEPAPVDEPPPDDTTNEPTDVILPGEDLGAGADRRRSVDSQSDLMADIPRFAKRKRWKGLGSKFLGRGLDDFQAFVGAGQADGTDPTAGLPSPTPPPTGQGGAAIPPPPVGGGSGGPPMPQAGGSPPGGMAGKWNPQMLQQLLPLLLALLAGSGGGAKGVGGAPSAPAPPAPATPSMPGAGYPPGMGGIGGGQDATEFDPSAVLRPTESGPTGVSPWREFGPRILPGMFGESGPTMLPQMPGESGPGMLDTSPSTERDIPGFSRDAYRGVPPGQGINEPIGGVVDPDRMAGAAYRGNTQPIGPVVIDPNVAFGTGQDETGVGGGGFQPPIDPQHVVGTGHKFGQAMGVGDPIHRGVDLQAPKGTPVKAPVDGVVKINHNPQGLGLEAVVVSPDGKEHKLGHLSSVTVKPGQQVRAGQVIGQVGDSGLTTGANLHYAEKKGSRYFNPSGKMGVIASMPPAPGTQMMSTDGAGGGPSVGAGQGQGVGPGGDIHEPGQGFPNLEERIQAGRVASRPDSGVDPSHPFGSYEESETLPSQTDIEDYYNSTATPVRVPRDPSQPSSVLRGPVGEDTPLYPWTRPDRQRPPSDSEAYVRPFRIYDDSRPYYPNEAPQYYPPLKQAVMGSGADARSLGVGAGAQFTVALPEGGFKTVNASDPVAARINAGVPPTSQVQAGGHQAHQEGGTATAGAAAGSPASLAGGGGGGGTSVSVDPATQARIQADLHTAQQQHDAQMAQIQQSANAENDRHAEELRRLEQAATQEADFRAIQEAVNAENTRHNQATEQLQRQQQALDVQLETMREQSSMALQRESEGFQIGQTARANALGVLQSSLNNPWIQALTKLGITPGGGASGGINPLMNLLNQILGGGGSGNLQQAGIPGGNQLPNVSPQEFQGMTVPQRAALRAQIEAMGPGMWQQFQSNFQNQAGTNQAPDQTQLQQAIWSPEDALGSQMSAEMFGEGQPAFQQRQQQNWNKSQGTNVMQSLLAGTGFG